MSAVVNNSQNWGDFKSRYLHWYVDLEIAFATEQSSIIAYFISKIKNWASINAPLYDIVKLE